MNQTQPIVRGLGAAIFMLMSFTAVPTRAATLLEDFQSHYPTREADLQEAYSHVKIIGTQTETDRRGLFMWKEHVEWRKEGAGVMVLRTALDSPMIKAWPVGAQGAYGGTDETYFDVVKLRNRTAWTFQGYGQRPDFQRFIHLAAIPIFAPYCIMDNTISQFINLETQHLVSAKTSAMEGEECVEVDAEMTMPDVTPDSGVWRTHLYFQPNTWLPMGFTRIGGDKQPPNAIFTYEERISYVKDSSPPKVSKVDYWICEPGKGAAAKCNEHLDEIESVSFGSLDPAEVTVASLGITQTPGAAMGIPIPHNDTLKDSTQPSTKPVAMAPATMPIALALATMPPAAIETPAATTIEMPVLPTQNAPKVNTKAVAAYSIVAIGLMGVGVVFGKLAARSK